MQLLLRRYPSDAECTLGALYVNGKFQCYTLEDIVRPEKIPGETAIPAGAYRVELTMSPRFGRILPLLIGVPNFTGVRMHAGNTKKDTDGCILVGTRMGVDQIADSRMALEALLRVLGAAVQRGEVITITIEDA